MNLTQFSSFILALLITSGCNSSTEESRTKVVGGTVTNGYTAVVQLGGGGLCSGTFIKSNVILTAAHCDWSSISYNGIEPVKNIRHPNFSMKNPQ
jgi:V8-like Glu-specific endopeptidase